MDCLGSATCLVVDFVVSDNNCIDFVDEADAVGSVTSSRDASSCNCFEFDRMHQKLEHVMKLVVELDPLEQGYAPIV